MRKFYSGEILFCAVLSLYVSQNIDAITGILRLNTFDIADSLCCMYLIDRLSQLLRCEVPLLFINTWGVNHLTFNYYRKKLQLSVWRYACVTDVFMRVALYLTVTRSTCCTSSPYNRELRKMSSFSGTGRSMNSWKRWLLWNKWLLQWRKKKKFDGEPNWSGVVNFHSI